MAAKRITYGDICHLLEGEGFTRVEIPGSHILFEHVDAKTSLILPVQKAAAVAAPRHMTMVKETLVDFGIMSEADVDRWIADPKHYQAA